MLGALYQTLQSDALIFCFCFLEAAVYGAFSSLPFTAPPLLLPNNSCLATKRSFWATPPLLPFAFELHGSDNNYMAAALGEQRRRKREEEEGLRGSGGGVGWAGGVGKRGGEQ